MQNTIPLRSRLIPLGLAVVLVGAARADYNPVPLTPGSFTQDIVIEKTAPPPLENFANVTIDQGTNNYGNTFFEQGYITNMPMLGLPAAGTTFTAHDNANITYVMPPSYVTNNCAFVGSQTLPSNPSVLVTQVVTATLTVVNPVNSYQYLSILYASGGSGTINGTVHYADNSQSSISFNTIDWFNTPATYAWIAGGRVQLDGSAPLNTLLSTTQTKVLHVEQGISPGIVSSVDFTYTGGTNRTFVFGISGSTDGVTYIPIPVSGFNADAVIEAGAPVNYVQGCNVSFDGGPANNGNTLYEQGFATNNYADQGNNPGGTFIPSTGVYTGLPHPGTALGNATHNYVMPSTYAGNCAVFIGNYAAGVVSNGIYSTPDYRSGNIVPTVLQTNTALSFLCSAGGSASTNSCTLSYNDGTSQAINLRIQDWFGGTSNILWTNFGRVTVVNPALNSVGVTSAAKLYYVDIPLNNTAAAVTNIALAYTSGNRSFYFGLSAQTNAGGSFYPLPITGFNADPIVEKEQRLFPGSDFNATTATMDLGTRNGNFTWFETGWVTNGAYSALGLPRAGSTINSLVDPTRHYQLPASYTSKNAILIDTNHQSALITPSSPTNYSAFSLLTAGASIGAGNKMSNNCVLFHADGTAETNLFIGYDWFDTTISPAYIAHARGDTRYSLAGSLSLTGNQNPRLFESFFALTNTGSAVTNILVLYKSAGGASWTTYILAVSATAGAVQPIVPNTIVTVDNTTASSLKIFEGSNAVFTTLTPVSGTAPLAYQWQFSADGTTWNNLTDGGTVTGSTTASLTNSSVGWTNSGQYRLYVCNVAACVTNFPATLTIYSSLPDVVVPTDPVTAYEPNGGSSPANQDVTKAIDDLVGTNTTFVSKYLNYGQNGSAGTSFAGPIGLIVTPNLGKSTVSALRIYTANDNQQRDPIDYTLEGSNDGGSTWTTVSSGALNLPAARNNLTNAAPNPLTQNVQEVHFANTSGYISYRLSFATPSNVGGIANSIQIGEVELLGIQTITSAYITQQPVPNVRVFVGASPTFNIKAGAYPPPLAYQWFRDNGGGPVAITGANSPSYTLINAQIGDSGAVFSCQVSNSIPPAATSASSTLQVITDPTFAYPTNVLHDHPVAYFRLDEGPDDGTSGGNNGVIAFDEWGGHNGFYTNSILQEAGYSTYDLDTAAYFGKSAGAQIAGSPDSCVEAIENLSFAATNASAEMSVEAWVMLDPVWTPGGPIAGAAIVCQGFGGGGEQFALDVGGPATGAYAHTFRFYVRDAVAPGTARNANGVVGPDPGIWHHVVGVLDEAHSNALVYVDGLLSGSTTLPTATNGLQSSTRPITIGARSSNATTNNNLGFYGTIDDVAIYNYALSSNQVMAHFLSANIAPRFTLQPTNTTVNEGATATFYSGFYGSPALTAQWYQSTDGGITFQPLGGQMGPTLSLPNVTAGMNNNQYYVQVANGFGSTNSAIAILSVVSGPPVLQSDVSPSSVLVYAGRSFTIASQFGGTLPITYQWYRNGSPVANSTRITGAQSNVLTVTLAQTNDIGSYQVFAHNAQDGGNPTPSGMASVTVETIPDFNVTGVGWRRQSNTNSPFLGFLGGDLLQLTDDSGSEATSAFYDYPLYIGSFKAAFTYQDVTTAGADGMAFVMQNDPRGAAALGGAGGSLGLSGITPSAALTFNIYVNNTVGMSFGLNGAHGTYSPTTPVNIASGDPITASVTYNGTAISLVLTDAVAQTSFTTNITVNLPSVLGTNTAYVGFTGGDGGTSSTQTISNFSFIPLPALSVQAQPDGSVLLSWPSVVGGYALLQETDLTAQSWQASPATVNTVGNQNQAVVSPTGAAKFYRLVLQQTEP